MPPTRESKATGFEGTGAAASRLNRYSIRIGWQFATNSYRCSPEPLHVALGLLLRGLADLVGDLGADLAVEQVLEGEPRAGQIEENLIEAALRVRLGGRPVLRSAAISGACSSSTVRISLRGAIPLSRAVFSIRSNSSGARRTVYGISGIGLLFIRSRRTRRILQ
jgi:hypothetical protein